MPLAPPRWERLLSARDELPQREHWARLRFAIIGPLLAAPPADGDLHQALECLGGQNLAPSVHRS